jgi:hypothetical protein
MRLVAIPGAEMQAAVGQLKAAHALKADPGSKVNVHLHAALDVLAEGGAPATPPHGVAWHAARVARGARTRRRNLR